MLALSTITIVWGDDKSSNEEEEEWYVLCIGAIHKRRRNILGGKGGSQISMFKDIIR